MTITFSDFNLPEALNLALADLGFTTPTAVQAEAIPAGMSGKDLLVSSQTGSGKTVAFFLPALSNLLDKPFDTLPQGKNVAARPQLLVLCPTRELAQQVMQDAIKLVRHIKNMRVTSIMGGMPFAKQIADLRGARVVIATPGRLLDLVNRRQISLSDIQTLIVDEADRMLDLGFSEDLEQISDLCASRGQTMMFSATFASRIIELASHMMDEPQRIAIETGHSTNTNVAQTLHWADGFEHKKKLLSHWLADETMDQAIVFASTQNDTEELAEDLQLAGHQVVALHGALPQAVRTRRIRTLREGRARILVATDVAARGLDIPTISHVINFGIPMKSEDYVHRIGRTGRAGRSGQAVLLATHRERGKVRALEDYLKARLNVSEIAGLEPSPPPPSAGRGAGRGGNSSGNGRGGFGGKPRRQNDSGRTFGESSFKSDRPKRSDGGFSSRPPRSNDNGFSNRPPRSSDSGEFGAPRSRFSENRHSPANGNSTSGRETQHSAEFVKRFDKPYASQQPRRDDSSPYRSEQRPRFQSESSPRRFDRPEQGASRSDAPRERSFSREARPAYRGDRNEPRGQNEQRGSAERYDRRPPAHQTSTSGYSRPESDRGADTRSERPKREFQVTRKPRFND